MEGKRGVGLTGDWDGRISRRTLLRTGGSAAAGLLVLGRAAPSKAAPPFEGERLFSLGVASGDPTPDGIVLWTRLAPVPLEEHGGLIDEPYGVRYEVAADEEFRTIVRRGAVEAVYDEAHTVHAEIAGLDPSTDYWYRFKFGTTISPVGRTRTAPPAVWFPTEAEAPFRFAFVSCQNYTNGYYTAYADLAVQDIELVVHVGDYIYEGPGLDPARVRDHVPQAEILDLANYRIRHAQYRTDGDLQAAHAAFPWLMTWDDHEFDNNYANLELDPDPDPAVDVAARRAAAYQAYWEHAPLSRSRKPVGKDMNLYRRAHWGALATFHVLDTRQYRDDQMDPQCTLAERLPENGYYCPVQVDPERTILGAAQRDWLLEGLSAQTSGWNVLANQVGFAPQDDAPRLDRWRFFVDPWDGYVADRQAVLDHLKDEKLYNTVVITGDKHQNSVRNVPESYVHIDGPAIATEFVGTSISSEGDDPRRFTPTHGGDPNNPHILMDDWHRGFVRVELTGGTWRSDFRVVETVVQPHAAAWTLESWIVQNGKPGAVPASGESSAAV